MCIQKYMKSLTSQSPHGLVINIYQIMSLCLFSHVIQMKYSRRYKGMFVTVCLSKWKSDLWPWWQKLKLLMYQDENRQKFCLVSLAAVCWKGPVFIVLSYILQTRQTLTTLLLFVVGIVECRLFATRLFLFSFFFKLLSFCQCNLQYFVYCIIAVISTNRIKWTLKVCFQGTANLDF